MKKETKTETNKADKMYHLFRKKYIQLNQNRP